MKYFMLHNFAVVRKSKRKILLIQVFIHAYTHKFRVEPCTFSTQKLLPCKALFDIGARTSCPALGFGPTLLRRASQVLNIAAEQKVERLILGAWGCGVFQNDPVEVASTFSLLLKEGTFRNVFAEVVFAIYDRSKEQTVLKSFVKRFDG